MGKSRLYCTNFDFNGKFMQVCGVWINNSLLKFTPLGCKFYPFLRRHGLTSSDPENSTGVWCVSFYGLLLIHTLAEIFYWCKIVQEKNLPLFENFLLKKMDYDLLYNYKEMGNRINTNKIIHSSAICIPNMTITQIMMFKKLLMIKKCQVFMPSTRC